VLQLISVTCAQLPGPLPVFVIEETECVASAISIDSKQVFTVIVINRSTADSHIIKYVQICMDEASAAPHFARGATSPRNEFIINITSCIL